MPIDGNEDHRVPLEVARRLTKRFRDGARGRGGPRTPHAHGVSRKVIEDILAQPGCMGLRIYHALDDQGEETLVIVGTTAEEQDMTSGVIAEQTRPCPPFCGDSELSSDGG